MCDKKIRLAMLSLSLLAYLLSHKKSIDYNSMKSSL